jgi:hypothetical protein
MVKVASFQVSHGHMQFVHYLCIGMQMEQLCPQGLAWKIMLSGQQTVGTFCEHPWHADL